MMNNLSPRSKEGEPTNPAFAVQIGALYSTLFTLSCPMGPDLLEATLTSGSPAPMGQPEAKILYEQRKYPTQWTTEIFNVSTSKHKKP